MIAALVHEVSPVAAADQEGRGYGHVDESCPAARRILSLMLRGIPLEIATPERLPPHPPNQSNSALVSADSESPGEVALYELGGKVAPVTGAAGQHGVGRAIALRLAREGADVTVTDLRDEPIGNWGGLSKVVDEIEGLGRSDGSTPSYGTPRRG